MVPGCKGYRTAQYYKQSFVNSVQVGGLKSASFTGPNSKHKNRVITKTNTAMNNKGHKIRIIQIRKF